MTRQMTIQEALRYYDCTERTIRRWIKQEKLKAKLVEGKYLIDVDLKDDQTHSSSPDTSNDRSEDLTKFTEQLQTENALLREQLTEKDNQLTRRDEQIDHLTQIVAMSQKNIGALTEQLDDSRQMIEDMRQRRTVWQRLRAVFIAQETV